MSGNPEFTHKDAQEIIFGALDGITAGTGVTIAASAVSSKAVLLSLLGLGIAEFFGMGGGQWLSDKTGNFRKAFIMACASFVGCTWLGIPWLVFSGTTARVGAFVMWLAAGCILAYLRPGKLRSYIETFAILTIVGIIVLITSRL